MRDSEAFYPSQPVLKNRAGLSHLCRSGAPVVVLPFWLTLSSNPLTDCARGAERVHVQHGPFSGSVLLATSSVNFRQGIKDLGGVNYKCYLLVIFVVNNRMKGY